MKMDHNPVVSCVLGTYNRITFLKLAIESARQELATMPHEIIVVDGGSDDGSLEWLSAQKDIITIIQHNHGYWDGKLIKQHSWGYFMNLGFKAAAGKYVCMISDDCLVIPGAILNGCNLFEEKLTAGENIGAVAFYWRNWPEQQKYWVGLTFGNKMFVNHGLFLKKALEDVHYIDENTYKFYHADGDLCLKMWQAGYQCIESPNSYIEHYSNTKTAFKKTDPKEVPHDWPNYLNKWKDIYYFSETNLMGGWLEKEFIDQTETYNRFG